MNRGDITFDTLLGNFRSSLAQRIRAIVTIAVTKASPLTSPAYDDGKTEPATGVGGLRGQYHGSGIVDAPAGAA